MSKGIFSVLIKNFTIIAAISSGLAFIIGHLSAYFYYSSLGLSYFDFTDLTGGFVFALKNPFALFTLISIPFLYILTLYSLFFIRSVINSDDEKLKKLMNILKIFLIVMAFFLTVLALINNNFVLDSFKSDLRNNLFTPYKVIYNRGNNELNCVNPLGTIGEYSVFIDNRLKPTLILQSNILSISPQFTPVPKKKVNAGKFDLDNDQYQNELTLWNKKWKEVCSYEDLDFDVFNFKSSGIPEKK